MRIKNEDERRFYKIEAAKQQWSVNDLERQYNSSLYERLALSRNKDEYNLYLPDKALLQRKLMEWAEEFEETREHHSHKKDS